MSKYFFVAIARAFLILAALTSSRLVSGAPFTAVDIGPARDGTLTTVTNGYDLSSRGREIGGTSDDFKFAYEQRTGNFDIQAQIESVIITDPFVHVGLMARGTLDANSPFSAVFSSSALLGTFFESRSGAGSAAQSVASPRGLPVNYPEMFLRLRRSGNNFTGFASHDGTNWQQIATASITLPSQVYFGIALASMNTNVLSTARVREIKDVVAPVVRNPAAVETLGPSNRRTGMVFSEIMYNPGPSKAGEDLEFIELFNAESFFLDLTGWKLRGGIEFDFPDGFRIEAGQFVVVAADPGAIQRGFGISGVLGPYRGHLNNSGEGLKLLNAYGATRLEVRYRRTSPWPAAADGTGHSMVLARPSYGEDDPSAWAASDRIGGSPGEVDAKWPNAWRGVLLNELSIGGTAGQDAFVEIYNSGTSAVDLSGCTVTSEVSSPGYNIPPGTILPAQGFLTVSQVDLGFSLRGARRVILVAPAGDRVIDLVELAGAESGVSVGRTPDGSPRVQRLGALSPNGPNAFRRIEEVVLNEVMYNPITGDAADTYIELHNASNQESDLSGWTLSDGIEFEFPQGTRVPAGGFMVVAKDLERLRSIYPQLNNANSLGNFSGNPSGSGDRIVLGKRQLVVATNSLGAIVTNIVFATVSEVSYSDGGRWPAVADGGGSGLELLDPRADTSLAANWAASDESRKGEWKTVEVNSKLEFGTGGPAANRLQILMQGSGECLIDDVEVIPSGSTNILVNGDFESPNATWRFQGNHSESRIEADAAFSGQGGLHLRAPGDGDTGANNVRGNLVRNMPTSGTGIIRARVKWVAGWPEVLFRVRGNYIELPARMDVPRALGTPGLANSRRVPNAPPVIYDVTHTPALPRASEPVVVTCRISDPDGVASPRVLYRVDPNTSLSSLALRDDGTGGDAVVGDGVYSATITGRSSQVTVAFRISANDDTPQPMTGNFPDGGRECLIRWDDPIPFGTFAHYHMWSTAATEQARGSNPDLDNTFRDLTLVYGNARVVYNAGFRDKGSPYHGGSGDFAVTVPQDEPLLGIDDRVFASTGNGGDESTYLKGDMAGWLGEKLDIPFLHSHYMRLYRNGGQYRQMMYDMEQPNRYYAKSWGGGAGVKDDLFKIAIWFEFDDALSGFNSISATMQRFLSDGQYKLARYRWNWQIRPGTETANDYSSIFNLVGAANSPTDRTRLLPQIADMEEWMRVFAYNRICGNWDSYTYRVGQNMYLYAPLGQRALLMPWDIDFVLGEGDAPSAANLFTAETDSVMQGLFNLPLYRRMLWRAYQDAANGPLLATNFQPQIDARRVALLRNGISATSPSSITSYMNARRNYINGQLARSDASSFNITTNNGDNFSSDTSSIALAGTAPFAVASIEVNGVPFPVTWTGVTNWQMTVPLSSQTNVLNVAAKDLRGQVITGAVDTVTVVFSGQPPQPRDWVVINEIQYHPAVEDTEFVELYNRHPDFAFDLSGYRLEGVDYTFPAGTLIQPNGYLVIVKSKAEFANAYGVSIAVLGPYNGRLQLEGETLRLVKPGQPADASGTIDEVRYSSLAPWPVAADGQGPSLQLIDPAQDNGRVGNWAAAEPNTTSQATPGRQNSTANSIAPFPNVWLNEVQPFSVVSDNAGEKEPWVELFNSDATGIDLSGLFLSDDPAQLTKWQFPAGTQLPGGAFQVLWLDGQSTQSTPAALHAGFRLSGTNGVLLLSRQQNGVSAVVDYLQYEVTTAGYSYGSYPDGNPRRRRMLFVATPGTTNNAAAPDFQVTINEWMAASQAVLRDPADGQFQDWFELYNGGTNTVDLSGYFLTDNQNDPTQFRIPAGYRIDPGGHQLVWADGEPLQNSPGRDLHVNFSLRADGEEIALFTPDEQLVTVVTFGPQTPNISEGVYPDGSSGDSVLFSRPTPGAANVPEFANRRPTLSSPGSQSVVELQTLTLKIAASDSDSQKLAFSLVNPPDGAKIDPQTGDFSWIPGEGQGPGTYTVSVRVSDNGVPPLSATATFDVLVVETNSSPLIPAIADVAIEEGSPYALAIAATDPDIPAQTLTFALEGDVPPGVTLDAKSGELHWTPSEAQGPGSYVLHLAVSDNGEPAAISRRAFNITVLDVNNPPVLEEIPIQTVAEGSVFTFQVHATDPDPIPVALIFSLENAPSGMTVDSNTGLISWTPGEADGPQDYTIQVRATEASGGLSGVAQFVLGVREVNTAPVIGVLGSIVAKPFDSINATLVGTDPDLPAQSLVYRAITPLPAGASVNPVTGQFSWQVPEDPPIGTNRITVEVTDDQTPALSAQQSFDLIVRAPFRVAINEIMARPTAPGAEFVELYNYSATSPADLSGWRLEGLEYTFPAGTVLAPGAFLCVARETNVFKSTYETTGPALGNAIVDFAASGGLLRLIRPGGPGFPDEVIDELNFSVDPPWPGAARQNASLQLIDPWKDHRRVLNWGAAANSTTNAVTEVVPMSSAWRYWQSDRFPGDVWTTASFDDSLWPSGGALLYVENDALPFPKVTGLALGQLSYYFRTKFNFAGNAQGAVLKLTTVLDDGAVFYLNGQEFYRVGMPAGAVTQSTLASRSIGNAATEGPIDLPATALKQGENVLAVEVHQSSSGSSDIVLGANLAIATLRSASFTPNAPNAVARSLETVPAIWINEVMPSNTSGIRDSAGDFDPWLELYNSGANTVSLNGWALTDDFSAPARWLFPAQTIIGAKSYLIVWLDGNTAQGAFGELHTSFRAAVPSGSVALTAPQNGLQGIVDYVNYNNVVANVSLGLTPDGNPLTRKTLKSATPFAANSGGTTSSGAALSVGRSGATAITISFPCEAGQAYSLESTSATDLPGWTAIANGTGTGSPVSIQQQIDASRSRFYRVVFP